MGVRGVGGAGGVGGVGGVGRVGVGQHVDVLGRREGGRTPAGEDAATAPLTHERGGEQA